MTSATEVDFYVVDVCGTLVRDDTTLGLLRYHLSHAKQRRFRRTILRIMTARRSLVRLSFVVLERLMGRHLLKYAAVKLLAGESASALAQSAAKYADILLNERRMDVVWPLIEEPIHAGHVVLASSSLAPVVACLAAKLGVRYVASELEQQNGVLTGRYTKDLTGRKEQALLEKFGPDALSGRFFAISDNLSDRGLLEKASQAYVVIHRQAHRQRWQGLNAVFLEVEK